MEQIRYLKAFRTITDAHLNAAFNQLVHSLQDANELALSLESRARELDAEVVKSKSELEVITKLAIERDSLISGLIDEAEAEKSARRMMQESRSWRYTKVFRDLLKPFESFLS